MSRRALSACFHCHACEAGDDGRFCGARVLQVPGSGASDTYDAASRRLLGEEHPDTLTAMLNLALTLKAQGGLAGARELEEQVLAASHRLLGEEHLNQC